MPYKDLTKQKEFQHQHYLKYKEHYLSKAKKRRKLHSDFVNSLKVECSKCRYNECKQALQFHHVNGEKLFNIAYGIRYNKETLIEEIKKCVLLCANCHFKEHCTNN